MHAGSGTVYIGTSESKHQVIKTLKKQLCSLFLFLVAKMHKDFAVLATNFFYLKR